MNSRDFAELRAFMRWKSDQYHRAGWADVFDRPWLVDLVDFLFSTHGNQFGGLVPCQDSHTGAELVFSALVTLPSSTR